MRFANSNLPRMPNSASPSIDIVRAFLLLLPDFVASLAPNGLGFVLTLARTGGETILSWQIHLKSLSPRSPIKG